MTHAWFFLQILCLMNCIVYTIFLSRLFSRSLLLFLFLSLTHSLAILSLSLTHLTRSFTNIKYRDNWNSMENPRFYFVSELSTFLWKMNNSEKMTNNKNRRWAHEYKHVEDQLNRSESRVIFGKHLFVFVCFVSDNVTVVIWWVFFSMQWVLWNVEEMNKN